MNKTLNNIILAVVIASGCTTTDKSQIAQNISEPDLSATQEVVLTVHGLSCPLCSNNLDGQLAKVEGVESAIIDLNTGLVTVRLAEEHSVKSADLAGAVKNAGFTLKDINPKKPDQ